MPFSSLLFVHRFLPVFLVVYWLAPRAAKNWVAIAASLTFYAWGAPRFLPVVVGLGLVDYAVSRTIAASPVPRTRKLLLAAGVTLHLSVPGAYYGEGALDALEAELAPDAKPAPTAAP